MEVENNIPDDFENLEKYAPLLAKVRKENCFKTPDGYFEGLSDSIHVEIIASQFNKENPFIVPNNYFKELPIEVEASIYASTTINQNISDTPASYFDELPNEIEAAIIASSFSKENVFEVPADYFDNLPSLIQNSIAAQDKKVLNLDWFSKTQLLAVAASVVIVCLVGINYWNTSNKLAVKDVASLEQAIEKTFDEKMDNVDESTLEDALTEDQKNNNSPLASVEASSSDYIVNYLIDNHIDISTLMNELKESE